MEKWQKDQSSEIKLEKNCYPSIAQEGQLKTGQWQTDMSSEIKLEQNDYSSTAQEGQMTAEER